MRGAFEKASAMLPAVTVHVAVVANVERASDERALWRDLNATRRAAGLPPLAIEPHLCAIARAHALDMAQRAYFDHDSPEGVDPFERLDRAGWQYQYAGENLALDFSEAHAHRSLLASPDHRENMLGPHYRRVGIAAIEGPQGELFVELFSD
jgi:uncharacterized protein YkwD